MTKKFDITAAIAAAATDPSQWEAIAKHFIAKQAKPRASKKSGPQTWACVTLGDGRIFLTSAYAKATPALTEAAHAASAQFRARMEDSGDRSDYNGWGPRVFVNPDVKPVPVASVVTMTTPEEIEEARDYCFGQRGRRQGWWESWRKKNPTAAEQEAWTQKAIADGNARWGTIPEAAARLKEQSERIAA